MAQLSISHPIEADLAKLANIICGRDRTTGQLLPPDHVIVKQLEPYSKWLYNHLQRHQKYLDAITWFEKAIHYFSDNPEAEVQTFVLSEQRNFPTGLGPESMRKFTLTFLSYWLTIDLLHRALDDVDETRNLMKNCLADLHPRTETDIRAGDVSLKELVYNGRLVPHAELYTDPLKFINKTALDVHKLVKYGRLRVKWTSDISRHLEIVEKDKNLLLFYLPCVLDAHDGSSTTEAVKAFRYYIPKELTDEIRWSYWLLFGNSRRGRVSFKRALKGDPETKPVDEKSLCVLCTSSNITDSGWARDRFTYLWPRILELKSHLDSSEPESIWGLLWHDKSQPYVYVPTFISGILFLMALASTGATIAQTWKAFQPTPAGS